jgi:hypothetical protein
MKVPQTSPEQPTVLASHGGEIVIGMVLQTSGSVQIGSTVGSATAKHAVAVATGSHNHPLVMFTHILVGIHCALQQPEQSNLSVVVTVEPVVPASVVSGDAGVTVVVSKDAGSVADGTNPGSGIQKPSLRAFDADAFSCDFFKNDFRNFEICIL